MSTLSETARPVSFVEQKYEAKETSGINSSAWH